MLNALYIFGGTAVTSKPARVGKGGIYLFLLFSFLLSLILFSILLDPLLLHRVASWYGIDIPRWHIIATGITATTTKKTSLEI